MLLDYDEWVDWETLPIMADDNVDEHNKDADHENAGMGVSYVHHATYQSDSNLSREKKTSEEWCSGLVEHFLYSKDNNLTHWEH